MYVFVCAHTHVHMCGGQRPASGVFFNGLPPYFLRPGLFLNLEFTVSPRLTGQQAPRICLSLPLQFWSCQNMLPRLTFYIAAGDPDIRSTCLYDRHITSLATFSALS